ncbi:MAG: InlB B-repeat-containing protein [Acutalibacteraceae bacterium]
MKKRFLSIVLILSMMMCLVPTSVFAEGEVPTGTAAIQFGTYAISVLSKNANSANAPTVYFGQNQENKPAAWRVIGYDGSGVASTQGNMTLLAAYNMGLSKFGESNAYADSDLKTAIDALAGKLTAKETDAVEKRTLATGSYNGENTDCVEGVGAAVSNAAFWPLSSKEANAVKEDLRIVDPEHPLWASSYWWLRSPGRVYDVAAYVTGYGSVDYTGWKVYKEYGVRPAFNLNLDSVLFASAAVGGKPDGGLQPVSQNYTGNEWKLTLYDSKRNNFSRTTWEVSTSTKGGTVEISYTDAKTGANEYISALIFDDVSNVIYYGRSNAPLTENDGTAQITIPAGFAEGTYTMSVFNEQYNGDCKTDLASGFADVKLTVEKQSDEQFTLALGGRYYFDLSAMNIPGTVNSNLPDSTLHYVPFTYAGTVDAYSVKNEADKDTTSYEHSLFIADYAMTHTVSWNELNEKSLIYGKDYAGGGVTYLLRAPSAGLHYAYGQNAGGTPRNNEWDVILDKAKQGNNDNTNGYVKNWQDIYSWGQDKVASSSFDRSLRGYRSSRYWYIESATHADSTFGFRPVLELPTDLAADSLKTVELVLGRNMPGETYNRINIIVKNGESFKAPAAEGLPRPDGISADALLWWKDEKGNYYKPGDTVPADVSRLSVLYGGFGLFLDRGDGAVEVTPDNYTDIFGDGTASFVIPKGRSLTELGESWNLTSKDFLEIYSTGRLEKYDSVFPNLKLKNADLTSVALSEEYIGRGSPFFITPDGKNTVGSLNGIGKSGNTLSILGNGSLTLNGALTLERYTQYGGSSVTMTDGLTAYYLSIDSGSLTVTGDPQAITMPNQDISDQYIGNGVRLFTGASAKDAAEADVPQLSAEMQEVYQRYLAGDNTLTNEEIVALSNALREQFNAIFRQLSGKTYVRFTNAWDVIYQSGTDGIGDKASDIKLYNDPLTLRGALFTRTGYTQTGWATVDGGEKVYGFEDIYTVNEPLTLYPAWNTNKYTITFDTAGGSEVAPITQDYNTQITAPANPTREGYAFNGWDKEIPQTMPAENITITAQWKDTEKPTGEISVGTNKWNTLLNNITFGLFFNETQTVTVDASDNSGDEVKIEYLLSAVELTEAELSGKSFTEYADAFSINPDNEYIIYVKLTDKSNNIAYISSQGIVLDGTSPVISGIDNGKTYCEAQTVTVIEKYIDTVTVNGKSVTLDENNQFVISPADGEQRIVVADKVGNMASVAVTVNDGHTASEDDGDCTTPVKCIYHNDVIVIPAKQHDFSGEWHKDENEHWHSCQNSGCTISEAKTAHSGNDDNDCTTPVACECGYVFTAARSEHTWGEWVSDGNGKHTHKCTADSCTAAETKDCGGGTATCHTKAVCDACHNEYGEYNADNHDGTLEWVQTATTHEKKWSCCKAVATAKENHSWENGICTECGYGCAHSGGTATCHTKAVCNACHNEYGEYNADNHDGTLEWVQTTTTHEKKWSCCKAVATAKENHSWENGICTECGYGCAHSGGNATCRDKAKCDVCGKSYGELNPKNHADLKHINAKAAATDAEGNIEYWYCDGCNKYFSDAAAAKEISKADTVIKKMQSYPKSPQTGYCTNLIQLWLALLFVGGGVVTGTTVIIKRRYNR